MTRINGAGTPQTYHVSKDENTSDVSTSNKGVEPSAEHTSGQQGEKYSAKADATMRSSMMGL